MPRDDYTHKIVNSVRVPLSEDEIQECVDRENAWNAGANDRAWANIRGERNRRIAATDFYALSDVTMSDAMTSYRSSLRDLPANTADPVAFQTQWHDHVAGKDGVADPWPAKP